MDEIGIHRASLKLLEACKEDSRLLPELIKIWSIKIDTSTLSQWKKSAEGAEWVMNKCQDKKQDDIVYLWQKTKHVAQLQVVEELLDEGLARPRQLSLSRCTFGERPINGKEEYILGTTIKCSDVPDFLERLHQLVENQSLTEAIAAQIKAISEAVDLNKQIFFHHGKIHPDGLWIKDGEKLISDNSTLIRNEAQRLGIYGNLNERERVRNRKGRTFLCGDDNQRLSKCGDKGVGFILEGSDFAKKSNHPIQSEPLEK